MNRNVNAANIVTSLRILSVPLMLYAVWTGNRELFFGLFLFAAFTDFLDGFLARTFRLQTPLGSKLDSTADLLVYLTTGLAVFVFYWQDFGPYRYSLPVVVLYFIIPDLYSLMRFGSVSNLHLYSWKAGGVLQFLFVLILFRKGFVPWLYAVVFVWTTLAFLENMYIQISHRRKLSDVKSFIHLRKDK